jgi:hypothetical protein
MNGVPALNEIGGDISQAMFIVLAASVPTTFLGPLFMRLRWSVVTLRRPAAIWAR